MEIHMLKQHYVLRTLCKTHKIDIRSFFIRLQKTNRHDFFICTVFLWSEFKFENIYSGVNFWKKKCLPYSSSSSSFFFFFSCGNLFLRRHLSCRLGVSNSFFALSVWPPRLESHSALCLLRVRILHDGT